MSKLRVLNVGAGQPGEEANSVETHLKGVEFDVATLDIDPGLKPDIVHDITQPPPDYLEGAFDIVFCSHTLEHVPYLRVGLAIRNMRQFLAPAGELYVIVPDIAWAARQIANGNFSLAVAGTLWGGQQTEWDYHRSGFTLLSLRLLMENEGFTTMHAFQSSYGILSRVGDHEEVANVVQNIVVGKVAPE